MDLLRQGRIEVLIGGVGVDQCINKGETNYGLTFVYLLVQYQQGCTSAEPTIRGLI